MYSPSHYKENDTEKIRALIDDNAFATLIGASGSISHLPLILEGDEILGHMARANPQWREFAEQGFARAIFHGPHAYISPAWYEPAEDNVPTWSYAVVHVRGRFEELKGAAAEKAMEALIARFEGEYGTGWSLPADRSAVQGLMAAITVFRLSALEFDAKFKLNQKQEPSERRNVAEQLRRTGRAEAVKLARMIGEV